MSVFIEKDDPCLKKNSLVQSECLNVSKVIAPKEKDLGGFSVRRLLPVSGQRSLGPWIFFDHMGPAVFKSGEGINVRPHPHINLATVTYTFEGEIWHRDSIGNSSPIKPGDINLMVAGSGIVHSERTEPRLRESGQILDGLQLWMALPEKDEEIAPAFYHYDQSEIPKTTIDGVEVRVMIGEAFGQVSPVKQFAKTLYAEARLLKGQKLKVPKAQELGVYLVKGSVDVGSQTLSRYHLAVISDSENGTIYAHEDSSIAFIGGESIGKRYMDWNFVSSNKERIEKAKEDWKANKFSKVIEDEEEFIPYPG
jgi:redox-sensitive bicupin YhaK (pirin superfamily)